MTSIAGGTVDHSAGPARAGTARRGHAPRRATTRRTATETGALASVAQENIPFVERVNEVLSPGVLVKMLENC